MNVMRDCMLHWLRWQTSFGDRGKFSQYGVIFCVQLLQRERGARRHNMGNGTLYLKVCCHVQQSSLLHAY